jgi:hypothetical protein
VTSPFYHWPRRSLFVSGTVCIYYCDYGKSLKWISFSLLTRLLFQIRCSSSWRNQLLKPVHYPSVYCYGPVIQLRYTPASLKLTLVYFRNAQTWPSQGLCFTSKDSESTTSDVIFIKTVWLFRCKELGYLSQYSVWLETGRPGDRGSILGRGKVFASNLCIHSQPGISASIVSARPGYRGSIPGRGERIFLLAFVSRLTLGPNQPTVQWEPVFFLSKTWPERDSYHHPI